MSVNSASRWNPAEYAANAAFVGEIETKAVGIDDRRVEFGAY